jgi:hypothetical protein
MNCGWMGYNDPSLDIRTGSAQGRYVGSCLLSLPSRPWPTLHRQA